MTQPDTEKFRLRRFVEKLVQQGECIVHDAPIDLIDVASVLDGNPKAVWFRNVGPEKTELVGNVMSARSRLAAALDTDEKDFPAVLRERLQPSVQAGRGVVRGGAGARGRADRRGRRSHRAARPSAAWPRRRALHLGQHRLCASTARPASPISAAGG